MAFNILNANFDELITFVEALGHKPFRARQLWQWVHQRGSDDFSAMSNLSASFRATLSAHAHIAPPPLRSLQNARDGCVKFLFATDADNAVESVLIPEEDRLTLCLSTQVGCAMACSFCATGHQGFNRQLTLAEVVGQLWSVNRYLQAGICDEKGGVHRNASLQGRRVSNIVLMGMGEPLANYKVTLNALKIFLDDWAYGLSRRRVTVSTSGLVPAIDQLSQDCPVALAISLHAPNDDLRSQLMPVNNRYPIAALIAACHRYLAFAPRSKVMLEYLLIEGVNNTESCLHDLSVLARDLPCKINLIPMNAFAQSPYRAPCESDVRAFAARLQSLSGRVVIIRRTRGEDVAGACGQLAGEVKDIRRSRPHSRISRSIPITAMPAYPRIQSSAARVASVRG